MSLLARGKRGGCSIVMTKKIFSIPDIQKYLKVRGFIISKKKNNKNAKNYTRFNIKIENF